MASALNAGVGLSAGTLPGSAAVRRLSPKSVNALPIQPAAARVLKSEGLRAANSSVALINRASVRTAPFRLVEPKASGSNPPPKGPRAAGQAYICQDCGYIYNERKSFDSLSSDYRCPVCSSPKRRFKPYTAPVARGANNLDVRKARKAELQSAGNPLPAVIGGIVLVLAGTYFYLNSTL